MQQVTGNGATLVLNGVLSGGMLTFEMSFFRLPAGGGAAPTTPTDSNGTMVAAQVQAPILYDGSNYTGCDIWYEKNAASGTHTVTPPAENSKNCTLSEWSGANTSEPLDVGATAQSSDTGTSQVTGTTASTMQADELALIGMSLAAVTGNTDVGFTDPVANYITQQKVVNDFSNIATFHAYRILVGAGAQSATFNWTYSEANQGRQAAIVTFKAAMFVPAIRARGFTLQQVADPEDEGRFNELDVRNWWREGLPA